jgi:hypothetical protein
MDSLLQENGDHLLQEEGTLILLETQGGGGAPATEWSYSGQYTMIPKQYRNLNFK